MTKKEVALLLKGNLSEHQLDQVKSLISRTGLVATEVSVEFIEVAEQMLEHGIVDGSQASKRADLEHETQAETL